MSNQHVLKIHPAPLADLLSGAKTAEVRCNDRGFQVGDTVRLMEVNPETGNWTGAADHARTISHIQTGYGLPDGMCVLSYAQPCHHRLADARNAHITSGYFCVDCGAAFAAADHIAPPAAVHGDEAVRKDAERYQVLRDLTEGLDDAVDAVIAEGAAMRAQGDGEVV